jgi:Tfp pilus tip-associated adhesin PilY1
MRAASTPSDNLGLSRTLTLSDSNVFIGDPMGTDFDLDMKDEAIYFGTVGAPVAPGTSPSSVVQGSLYRLLMNENSSASAWGTPAKILSDLNRPFVNQPAVTLDSKYRRWVVAASGRLLVTPDKETQNQQSLYGIIDKTFSGASVPTVTSDLVNVSNAQVFANDRVTGVTLATGSDANADGTISTKELRNAVAAAGGWRRDMQTTSSAPSERSANRLTVFGQILFGALYTPSTDLCGSDGSSRLLGLDFSTGAASLLGVFPCSTCNDPTVPLPDNISLGAGYSSSASIHFGEQTIEGKVTVITQDSRGELEANKLTTGSGDPASEISWREYRGE